MLIRIRNTAYRTIHLIYTQTSNRESYSSSRFGFDVTYQGSTYTQKTFKITRGSPLPYTLSYGKGAFVFVVHKDLTVTFNNQR
jgi:hypothetical protein